MQILTCIILCNLAIVPFSVDGKLRALHGSMEHDDSLSNNCPKENLANFMSYDSTPIVKPASDLDLWIDDQKSDHLISVSNALPWLKKAAMEFIRDGYVVIRGGVSLSVCQHAIDSFNRWCALNIESCESVRDINGHLPRVINSHTVIKEIQHVITKNKKALQLQDFLFGEKTSMYTSLFFTRGTQQRIHVDIPFFWTYPKNRYFGVWTALEDVDADNGPLRVLVRGHQCNILNQRHVLPQIVKKRSERGSISSVDEEAFYIYADATIENCARMNITEYVDVHLKAGDTIIWHPLLPHGGSAIQNMTRTRYSLVAHTVPEMVPVYHTDVFFDPSIKSAATAPWGYHIIKEEMDVPAYRLMADLAMSVGKGY